MADELAVVMSHGPTDERASVGFTIVNGGLTAGMSASVFLTADAVDIARRGAVDLVHAHPMDPLKDLVADFLSRGGTLWACPPCVKARGYGEGDLIEGVEIVGASALHARIQAGAATLCF